MTKAQGETTYNTKISWAKVVGYAKQTYWKLTICMAKKK